MPAMVRAENISKTFAVGEVQVQALRGVSLTVEAGEFVSIVGASGSGKSTLLHVLGGLTTPTSGKVFIEGTEYGSLSDAGRTALRRNSIGIVFQKFNLLPTLDARGNIEIAREIAGALINQPRILLADEPTGNLDSKNSDAVLGVLAELNRELRQTILMITHNAAAAAIAHRMLHMRDGAMAAA